jgi:rod shape determining protein RodA
MNRHVWLSRLRRLHFPSAIAMLCLMVVGVVFVYSAGYRGEDQPDAGFHRRQIVWCVIGVGVFVGAAVADYRRVGAQAAGLYLAGIAALVIVLLFGMRVYGARRWLDLFGQRVQPSEFAKLATILALARYLSRPQVNPRAFSTVTVSILLVGIPFLLIAAEPDLGSAAALAPVAVVLLIVAGVPWKTLGGLGLAAVVALPLGWFALGGYQRDRLLVFLDPGRDPLGAGWNSIQSAIAVGSGGLQGKGFLRGTQNVLGFLPRTVAPTDFIFSVIAEEKGFVGSAALLGLYAILMAGGLRAAARARDKFGQLWAAGLTALLFFHVFTNIAMTIGLMPVTGLPLPFVSYGGSFMTAAALAAGEIQSVYIRRHAR